MGVVRRRVSVSRAARKHLGRLSLCVMLLFAGALFPFSLFWIAGRTDLWPNGRSSMMCLNGGRLGLAYEAPSPESANGQRNIEYWWEPMSDLAWKVERTRNGWYGLWGVWLTPPQHGSLFISLRVPLWPVTLIAWPIAFLMMRSAWRIYRRPPYLCVDCGYDLRGISHAERCPECGARIPDAARQHSQPT